MRPKRLYEKYTRLVATAIKMPAIRIAIAHPCDELSLRTVVAAAGIRLIDPILVGPAGKVRAAAQRGKLDISAFPLIDAAHSHDAATRAVALVREGQADALMKGSLQIDELLGAVVARETGIRGERRISHCSIIDMPGHGDPLLVTDAAMNIAPTVDDRADVVQNAIDLARALQFSEVRVAILSAMETIKMADRGQFAGAMLGGPLWLDNVTHLRAMALRHVVFPVAGRANILVAPNQEAGNMLASSTSFLAGTDAAEIVLGARVPIIATNCTRALVAQLVSCAVASLVVAALRGPAAPPLK